MGHGRGIVLLQLGVDHACLPAHAYDCLEQALPHSLPERPQPRGPHVHSAWVGAPLVPDRLCRCLTSPSSRVCTGTALVTIT